MLIADFLTTDVGPENDEASVLIQAIMSIKSTIEQDPLSHEKVFHLFNQLTAATHYTEN